MNKNTEIQMNYFIYCRKSSEQEDRQVLSLPAQMKELQALADKENLHIVHVYQESKSAHKKGRDYFEEMLHRIEQGEANGIIVWDESRIARNSWDGGRVIYMMDLEQIVEIRKPSKIYRNTPDDKSWLQMCFMMSKKESDDKGVNVERGLRTKAEQGWFPSSWTKPGYMWDKMAERGNKTILNDPIRYPLIKKCWELMLTGAYTVPQILKILNEDWGYRNPTRKSMGGTKMARSTLYLLFCDPFYYGEFEYPEGSGKWYTGKHEPMITQEEFERVQMLLGKPRHRTSKHDFALTGFIRCGECDAMVTAEEKWQMICSKCKTKFASGNKEVCPKCNIRIEEMVKPTILHYVYYHCTKRKNPNCMQGSIAEDKLEPQADEILKQINISEHFMEWALKHLDEENDEEITTHNAKIDALQKALKDCVARIDNLVKLKISPVNSDGSLLNDSEYKEQKEALVAERKELEKSIEAAGQQIDQWIDNAEEKFSFAVSARYRFATGTPQVKREILVGTGSNLTLRDKILRINWETTYGFIEQIVENEPTTSATFEPAKEGLTSSQLEALWAQNPTVLRD